LIAALTKRNSFSYAFSNLNAIKTACPAIPCDYLFFSYSHFFIPPFLAFVSCCLTVPNPHVVYEHSAYLLKYNVQISTLMGGQIW
jgi:hypothetical protein